MKIKELFSRHWIFIAAIVLVVVIMLFNSSFQKLISNNPFTSDDILEKALNEEKPSSDLVIDGSQVYVDRKRKEKNKENPKVTPNRQPTAKSPPRVLKAPTPGVSVTPPKKEPLLFSDKKIHRNIFKPYYLSENQEKLVETPSFEALYKGYYTAGNEKIAIFKMTEGLVYSKQGQLLGNSDYMISEIELKWVKLTNIHNSNNVILYLGGEKK